MDNAYAAAPPKKNRGCLYGCLAVLALFVLLIVVAIVAMGWFWNRQVEAYSSPEPLDLPTVEIDQQELQQLRKRVDRFSESPDDDGPAPTEKLVLSAKEINALISNNNQLSGHVFVEIENDELTGKVSLPVDDTPLKELPGLEGRYLNAEVTFDISLQDDQLEVNLRAVTVNGERLPSSIEQPLITSNLAEDINKDPETAKFFRQFKSISIEGDRVILIRKPVEEITDEASEETPDEATEETPSEATEETPSEAAEETPSEAGTL